MSAISSGESPLLDAIDTIIKALHVLSLSLSLSSLLLLLLLLLLLTTENDRLKDNLVLQNSTLVRMKCTTTVKKHFDNCCQE